MSGKPQTSPTRLTVTPLSTPDFQRYDGVDLFQHTSGFDQSNNRGGAISPDRARAAAEGAVLLYLPDRHSAEAGSLCSKPRFTTFETASWYVGAETIARGESDRLAYDAETINTNNTRKSETVWSGAGSGCSAYEPKPTWETDTGCTRRTVADVAADADPNTGAAVYDTVRYQGFSGWFQVGGTSLASPIIAAVYALADNGGSTIDGSYPYSHLSGLFDVTSGSMAAAVGYFLSSSPAN